MSFVSQPYWWVECDAPGCGAKSTEGHDYAAWGDKSDAWEDASDAEWVRGGDQHFCSEHRRYVCGECDKSEGRQYPLEQEGMCDECWAEDAAQNHGRVVA